MVVLVMAFVVFMERGQRRIAVNYAKRQQGRKMVGGQRTKTNARTRKGPRRLIK
jgi:preprotein translocase subunit SecY